MQGGLRQNVLSAALPSRPCSGRRIDPRGMLQLDRTGRAATFHGVQSGEWLLQQFPVSASTCISVLQGRSLPCHQGRKTDLIRAGFG